MSRQSFARLAAFITSELGIQVPPSKSTMLQARLQRRLHELQLPSVDAYEAYLRNPAHAREERAAFISAVTTNKTDFFREPQHFAYLLGTVLPAFEQSARGLGGRFQLWSAGCSSGEEPYTLAMLLADYFDDKARYDFALLGTDISPRVLALARAAIYPRTAIHPVPQALRQRHLLEGSGPAAGQVRVSKALRAKVAFHPLNFMDPSYPIRDSFHAIFFRNVMIYFDRPTQQSVVQKLARHLQPGGYLFIGHSESLLGLDVPLVPVAPAVFRKPA